MKYLLTLLLAIIVFGSTFAQSKNIDTFYFKQPPQTIINGHRLHVEGMTYTTYPPFYSCAFCFKEFSPIEFLPKVYRDMRFPIILGNDTAYFDGYGIFCDSLKKHHINEDSFFFAQWNKADTTCISYEIAVNKSEDIWTSWKKSHKAGRYFLDKNSCMDTDGFMAYYDDKGEFKMGMGGRYDDKVLLADKWYKIIYDKPKNKK